MTVEIKENPNTENLDQFEQYLKLSQYSRAWDLVFHLLETSQHFDHYLFLKSVRKSIDSPDDVTQFLQEGMKQTQKLNYSLGEGFVNFIMGLYYANNNQTNDARLQYEKALEIWQNLNNKLWMGITQRTLAEFYVYGGSLKKGREFMEKALVNHKTCDQKEYTYSLVGMANLCYSEGNFDNALDYTYDATCLAIKLKDCELCQKASFLYGVIQKRQGKLTDAINYFQTAIEFLKNAKPELDSKYFRGYLFNLAHTYEMAGEHKKAELIYRQLLDDDSLEDSKPMLSGTRGLGNIALINGDFEKAMSYFESVIDKARKNSLHTAFFAEDMVALISIYVKLKDYDKAQSLLDEARMFSQSESKFNEIFVTYGEGVLLSAQRNLMMAKERFQKCLRLAEEVGLAEYRVRAIFQLASLELIEYQISGEKENLILMQKLLDQAKTVALKSYMVVLALEISLLKAMSYSVDLDFDSAISILEETENEADRLGLDKKSQQAQTLLEDIRKRRLRAINMTNPEFSWDERKIGGYLTNVQNLIRSFSSEGREFQ